MPAGCGSRRTSTRRATRLGPLHVRSRGRGRGAGSHVPGLGGSDADLAEGAEGRRGSAEERRPRLHRHAARGPARGVRRSPRHEPQAGRAGHRVDAVRDRRCARALDAAFACLDDDRALRVRPRHRRPRPREGVPGRGRPAGGALARRGLHHGRVHGGRLRRSSLVRARGSGSYWENRDGDDRAPTTVAHAAAWLRDEATEPFFLFSHTYQPHDPYFSPPEYERMLSAADGTAHPASAVPHGQELLKYDAAVRYTDTAVAPLLDAVRSGRRGSRTLLVITSDHGEGFGEHGGGERGGVGHGAELYEEALRVPLIFSGPGLVATGRRVPGLVGVVDVTPTILDLLGFPVPTGISGVSLAPQVRAGSTVPPVAERILFSENSLHDRYRLAARWPGWKAVWDTPGLQTFDLDRDPGELQLVTSADLTDQATAARARFEQECARQQAEIAAAGSRQAQPAALPDPERQRQLKALGYVE